MGSSEALSEAKQNSMSFLLATIVCASLFLLHS